MTSLSKKLILIAAPSGAGKTTVTRHLLKAFPDKLAFSISAATRPPRPYERDKIDYYFISVEEFTSRIQLNEFVEWEMVYEGKYYGTLKSELDRIWAMGKLPLLDVDVNGGIHIQKEFASNCLSLFIEPPSLEELRRRLLARGTETPESLNARMAKAAYELEFRHQFDRLILNDSVERACAEAETIVRQYINT